MAERSQAPTVYTRHGSGLSVERIHYRTFARHVPRHFHDEYQISACGGGYGCYRFGTQTRRADPDTVHVFAPATVHTYHHEHTDDAGSVYRSLYIDVATMDRALEDLHDGRPPDRLPSGVLLGPAPGRAFAAAHDALLLGGSALERDAALTELVAAVVGRHEHATAAPPAVGRERAAVRRVEEYLRDHVADGVRLADLARVGNLSTWRINRAFSRAVGMPPHEYLNQLRVARARSLLARGRSIAEVASETGFADQAHLTRRFKRIVGVTPGRYARGGKNVQDAAADRLHTGQGRSQVTGPETR